MTEKSIYVHDLVVLLSSIMFCLLNVMQIMKFSPLSSHFSNFRSVLWIEKHGSKKFYLSFDTSSSLIPPGIVHDDLKNFLEANVSIGKKKSKVTLGVSDPRIGAAIQESVNIQCESDTLIIEVTRGVRVHFEKMIKGLTGSMSGKAQLGLGHSYSRAKVKFNIHRVDNMIIQSISLLDQLDKDINTFSMRIRFVVVYVILVSEWAEEELIDCSFD